MVLQISMISHDNFHDVEMIELFLSPSVSLKDLTLAVTIVCKSLDRALAVHHLKVQGHELHRNAQFVGNSY